MKKTYEYDDSDDDEKPAKKSKSMEKSLESEMGKNSFRSFLRHVGVSSKDEDKAMRHLSNFVRYSASSSDDSDEDSGDEWDTEDYGKGNPASGGGPRMEKQRKELSTYSSGAYDDDDDDFMKDRFQQNGQYLTNKDPKPKRG